MNTQEALFAAVCAAPDADLPRLVLADHFDELGEHVRAEFVRLQCRMARLSECLICVGSAALAVGPGKVVPCPVCERPALLRRQNELFAPDHLPALLDPVDRDSFELVSYRPTFERGFLSGVTFTNFDPFHCDPPIFPFEEVGDDWHRLCDLMARNPLANRVVCPDWFDLTLSPVAGGPRLPAPDPVPALPGPDAPPGRVVHGLPRGGGAAGFGLAPAPRPRPPLCRRTDVRVSSPDHPAA